MSALPFDHFQGPRHTFRNESPYWDVVNFGESYEFELIDVPWWLSFIRSNWIWPFYAAAVYLVAIFGLEKWMKGRREFDLRLHLVLWNSALGIFSIVGFMRSAPIILSHALGSKGPYQTLCFRDQIQPQVLFWTVMFAISKFVELGDTLFIVFRKRKLQLLQYYHHIATLIVVWLTTPDVEPVGLCYIVMNYGVHSLMYPYFALAVAGVKIPRVIAKAITTAQFLQMIAGFLLNAATIALIASGRLCFRTSFSIWLFVALYGSFIVLFGNLFRNAVLKAGAKRKMPKSD